MIPKIDENVLSIIIWPPSVVLTKIFDIYSFLSADIHVEGVKIALKVEV